MKLTLHAIYIATAGAILLSTLTQAFASGAAPCRELFAITPWFEKFDAQAIEKELKEGTIISRVPLHEALKRDGREASGTTEGMELFTFASGVRAVFKPGDGNLAEVSAYHWAKRVKFRLIPPTVKRTVDGVTGSLQYYVDTPIDLLKLAMRERREWLASGPAWQNDERNAFNFVFGNWDLNWGNVLVDLSRTKVQIDNRQIASRQQVRFGERAFILRMPFSDSFRASLGHPTTSERFEGAFPFDQAIFLEKPNLEQIRYLLAPFADPKKLADYLRRREKAGTTDLTMRIALWRGGIWIQAIGFQSYGLQPVGRLTPEVKNAYESLTFEILKSDSPISYSDDAIYEILDRRDQLLKALR